MPKLSIVTAYYNRKEALIRTILTITKSSFKNFEFIIVDDASDESQRLEDLASLYSFIKLIRIDPSEKTYINPCIPFNIGFEQARGDFIVIQNPECMYVGDILSFVMNNLYENKYLVFSCYSLGNVVDKKLNMVDFNLPYLEFERNVAQVLGNFNNRGCDGTSRYDSWFIHPKYRVAYFNFLAALTRKDLYDLGGFDERFAHGYAADDTDLVARIKKKGMNIELVEKPFCLHQFHPFIVHDRANLRANEARNRALYEESRKLPHYRALVSRLNSK